MKVWKKKAAHFLLVPELVYSPPNDAIITSLLNLGYAVDLFAPGGNFHVQRYGESVRSMPVNYDRKWLTNSIFSFRWFGYDVFSGTSEDPMAVVGLLSLIYRKPSFCLADEIKSGSYSGDAPEYWKKLCRFGMRQARFNIVNDQARISLQKEYANLKSDADVIVYPGCFKYPTTAVSSKIQRQSWGVPERALVLSYSGGFNMSGGADWLLGTVAGNDNLFLVLQPMKLDDMTNFLLHRIACAERIFIEEKRLEWRDAWASMGGIDIGVVIYRNTAPQFQNMGISSNKLCMYLAMGVPVIALKQESFYFIEDYKCGILVDTEEEFREAIDVIGENLEIMKKNALQCAKEYIAADKRYAMLVNNLDLLN